MPKADELLGVGVKPLPLLLSQTSLGGNKVRTVVDSGDLTTQRPPTLLLTRPPVGPGREGKREAHEAGAGQ